MVKNEIQERKMNDDYFLKWIALPVFAGIVVGLLLAIIYVLI